MIFDRLAIGTANWGKEYNGAKVSEDDQERILDYCQCSGIDTIDTAESYGWDWTKVSSYFNVIVKVKENEIVKALQSKMPSCLMSHDKYMRDYLANYGHPLSGSVDMILGDSIYYEEYSDIHLQKIDILQVPYSIYDRRFEKYFAEIKSNCVEIHVRSIFLRGKILKEFSPQQCISFCLMNPNIDKVIIGADSYKQFKENLRPFHDMNVAEKHDINLLDPRKWK